MLNILGYLVIGIALTIVFPFTEFGRSMASNPDAFKRSKTGCVMSLIGIALLIWLVVDIVS